MTIMSGLFQSHLKPLLLNSQANTAELQPLLTLSNAAHWAPHAARLWQAQPERFKALHDRLTACLSQAQSEDESCFWLAVYLWGLGLVVESSPHTLPLLNPYKEAQTARQSAPPKPDDMLFYLWCFFCPPEAHTPQVWLRRTPAEQSADLRGLYLKWKELIQAWPSQKTDLHLYLHLWSWATWRYQQTPSAAQVLYKAPWVNLSRKLWQPSCVEGITEFCQQAAPLQLPAYQALHKWSQTLILETQHSELTYTTQNYLYQQMQQGKPARAQIVKQLNQYLLKSPRYFLALDAHIRTGHTASSALFQPQELREVHVNTRGERQALDNVGRKQASDQKLHRAYQQHRAHLSQLMHSSMLAPPHSDRLFEHFHTRFISEGELRLWAYWHCLLKEAESEQEDLESRLREQQILPDAAAPSPRREALWNFKLQLLYDACERLFFPERQGGGDSAQSLPEALKPWAQRLLFPMRPEQETEAAFITKSRELVHLLKTHSECASTLRDYLANQAVFDRPALLNLHRESLVLAFQILSYEDVDSASVPASFLSATLLTPRVSASQNSPFPFVASLYRYALQDVEPPCRLLIETELLRQRQQEQRTQQELALKQQAIELEAQEVERALQRQLQREQVRVAEYERVREKLDQLQNLRHQEDQLWDALTRAIEPPALLKYGVESPKNVQAAFQRDKHLGPAVQGMHRSDQLDDPTHLAPFLRIVAHGLKPGARTGSPESFKDLPPPAPGSFLAQLENVWRSSTQELPLARRIFNWLKAICYDVSTTNPEHNALTLGAWIQAHWRLRDSAQSQQRTQFPVWLWEYREGQLHDCDHWLKANDLYLLQNARFQQELLGTVLDRPNLDTRSLAPHFLLGGPEPALSFLDAYESLLKDHLKQNAPGHCFAERIQAVFQRDPACLVIEIQCRGALSSEARARILKPSNRSRDFAACLHTLARSLGEEMAPSLSESPEPFRGRLTLHPEPQLRMRIVLGHRDRAEILRQHLQNHIEHMLCEEEWI